MLSSLGLIATDTNKYARPPVIPLVSYQWKEKQLPTQLMSDHQAKNSCYSVI
jgi:hypothetical protein